MLFVRGVIARFDMLPQSEVKDSLLVCLPRVLATSLSIIETALWVQKMELCGKSFYGGPVDVYTLAGRKMPHDIEHTAPAEPFVKTLRFAKIRSVARTKSWTSWRELPVALLAPEATAITHNALLRSNASKKKVNFQHAEVLLNADLNWKPCADHTHEMLSIPCKEIDRVELLSLEKREIVKQIIFKNCSAHCEEAQVLTHSARRIAKLPPEIWGGAGGYRPARAIRIEAQRRGSWVVGHDHSCSTGMIDEQEGLALAELAVANEFVLPTDKSLSLFQSDSSKPLLPKTGQAKLSYLNGDSSLAWELPKLKTYRGVTRKPRVLYVSGAFIGFRQRIPPRIPDVVKLDWQIRLIKMLVSMDIEFKSQMHPGGVLQGQPHPANVFCAASNSIFEKAAEWAQVFVFDVVQSTTFPLALVTDRPIVLIDHGMSKFSKKMQTLLQQRCIILRVARDQRNRVIIKKDLLEHSIMEAAKMNPDPTPFREMYAGKYF